MGSVINHMHYLGRAMKIELFRDGRLIKELSNDEYYSYDNPVEHKHDPPVEVRPGDEIKTTCVYNSLSSDRWVYYGDGTSDEMCFGFITLYPREGVPYGDASVSVGPASSCEFYNWTPVGGCDWAAFINASNPETAKRWYEVERNCNLNGFCRPECRELVAEIKRHPCMQGDMARLVTYLLTRYREGSQFLGRTHSCPDNTDDIDCSTQCADVCGWDDVTDSATGSAAAVWLVSLTFALGRLINVV